MAIVLPDSGGFPLAIRLFGPCEVRVHGVPLPRLRSRKGYWLLALLALRRGAEADGPLPVERAWLAAILWPDSLEPQALGSLRISLKDLRGALGVEASRLRSPTLRTLALDLAGAQVDVLEFDAAVARGDPASLAAACSLYRGPLLEECGEEWVFQERQARAEAHLAALERLAAEAMAGGDPARAERYARRAVAVDPLRESAHRGLMEAQAAGGNYAAVLSTYRELRLLLYRELNADPDTETRALYEAIRAEARQKAALPPSNDERPTTHENSRSAWVAGRSSFVVPEGTLTFLFTDIEGSIRLWEAHPEAMREALARHDALLRHAIEANGGYVFKTVGDQFCAAFASAPVALEAALAAQHALSRCGLRLTTLRAVPDCGDPQSLRVRMALHTGTVEARDGDYFGLPLNRVKRLLDAGHGGQILLSAAARELTSDRLPVDATLRDLGLHRLRDLQQPEHLFQLLHLSLPAEFPPLRSLEAFAHNLPAQWTRFIGRERTMAEVKRLLTGARLLTLTGTGGCGKTRLALQVAADLLAEYDDGVWLVELASLADPMLVPRTVAATLGLREDPARSPVETLLSYLRPRALLLLLDNCEHLLSACAELAAELLRGCPHLRLLATSREELGIVGEQTYPVPPLSLPDPTQLPPLERLREFEAVQLFADRAALSQPSFVVTRANATAVAQVCHHLDGIPLAIELAARVKVMSVEQLAGRLDDVFRLLTGGSRTALPRQRTLRAMIDWSYDLLSEEERALLRRLSVFAGGWTLAAAEAVSADNGEILDLLTQLAEKSLVAVDQQAGVARYRFLETVRQYSRERLNEAGEAEAVRGSHLEFFLRLAEAAEPNLTGPDRRAWLERLDREHDNLRAALEWSRASDNETALRLAGALFWFWNHRGHAYEGRVWLEKALSGGRPAAQGPERTASRAKALWAAGTLAWIQCDHDAARPRLEESITIWKEVGDKQGLGRSLRELGNVLGDQGDPAMARALHEESTVLFRETVSKWDLALSLGAAVYWPEDNAGVIQALGESLALYRELRDDWGIALALEGLGLHAAHNGDHATARSLFEDALARHRTEGDKWNIAELLNLLGEVTQRQGEPERAAQLFRESLPLHRDVGDRGAIGIVFHNLGAVAQLQGQHGRAARLFAAAEVLREGIIGTPRFTLTDCADRERNLAAVRAALDEAAFATEWAEGRAMTLEQAIRVALEEDEIPTTGQQHTEGNPGVTELT